MSTGHQSDKLYFPTRDWLTATPTEMGMDHSVLATLDAEFSSGQHGYVDDLLIVKNGYVIFEKSYTHDYNGLSKTRNVHHGQYDYYDPDWHPFYRKTELHTLQSITKSITSALIGIVIERGVLPGVDMRLLPIFEDFSFPDSDPRRMAMTLRDALTMTVGIRWDESGSYMDSANMCARMEQSEDWIQFILDQPMAESPGRIFEYNSGATQLLSHVIWKTTGMQAEDFSAEYLFKPLGIKKYFWKRTPQGLADTEGGLYLTPRDLAKIGILYLRDGIWERQRILPKGWVAESTAPLFSTESEGLPDRRYGYSWWLLPRDHAKGSWAIAAIGYGEQRLLIAPGEDLVIVTTGWNIDMPGLNTQQVLDRILVAYKG